MSKRAWVVLLVGVNLLLLTSLIVTAWDLPKANAQAAPLASNYMMVAGVIMNQHDGLYIIDLSSRRIHMFEVDRTSKQLVAVDVRDLKQDFRQGR